MEQLKEKWAPLTLEQVRIESAKFAVARNWTQFHRPRNIMAALTSEAGEVSDPQVTATRNSRAQLWSSLDWLWSTLACLEGKETRANDDVFSLFLLQLTEALGLWRDVGFGGKGLSPEGQQCSHPTAQSLDACPELPSCLQRTSHPPALQDYYAVPDMRPAPAEKHHVGEELTDCLVYLLRLADVLDVDLPQAVEMKLQKNAAKYPVGVQNQMPRRFARCHCLRM